MGYVYKVYYLRGLQLTISISESNESQAQIMERTLKLMTIPDPSGNSWKFVKLIMYPSFDSSGLFQVVVLKFVDNVEKPLYAFITRSKNPKYYTTSTIEEIQ
jgi:hypothetical protein